jgi:hypothetical protein
MPVDHTSFDQSVSITSEDYDLGIVFNGSSPLDCTPLLHSLPAFQCVSPVEPEALQNWKY